MRAEDLEQRVIQVRTLFWGKQVIEIEVGFNVLSRRRNNWNVLLIGKETKARKQDSQSWVPTMV